MGDCSNAGMLIQASTPTSNFMYVLFFNHIENFYVTNARYVYLACLCFICTKNIVEHEEKYLGDLSHVSKSTIQSFPFTWQSWVHTELQKRNLEDILRRVMSTISSSLFYLDLIEIHNITFSIIEVVLLYLLNYFIKVNVVTKYQLLFTKK